MGDAGSHRSGHRRVIADNERLRAERDMLLRRRDEIMRIHGATVERLTAERDALAERVARLDRLVAHPQAGRWALTRMRDVHHADNCECDIADAYTTETLGPACTEGDEHLWLVNDDGSYVVWAVNLDRLQELIDEVSAEGDPRPVFLVEEDGTPWRERPGPRETGGVIRLHPSVTEFAAGYRANDLAAVVMDRIEQVRAERAAHPTACQLGLVGICRGEEAVQIWDDEATCARCMLAARAMASQNDDSPGEPDSSPASEAVAILRLLVNTGDVDFGHHREKPFLSAETRIELTEPQLDLIVSLESPPWNEDGETDGS